jgi:hypothetical protein
MDRELQLGDTIYVVHMVVGQRGALDAIEVSEGIIESLDGDTCRVRHRSGVALHQRQQVCFDKDQAEERRFAIIGWLKARNEVKRNGGKLAALPEPLHAVDGVIISGNPLRAGEPNIAFNAQSNAWGKQDSPQKVLQRLGAIFEDIHHLEALLSLIPHGSEYAKRLISKYVILELHAAVEVLRRLATLDHEYKQHDYPQLVSALEQLDARYKFRIVRDKLSAHRDGDLDVLKVTDLWARITRRAVWSYFDAFEKHLRLLAARYRMEVALYFNVRGKRMAPTKGGGSTDYLPFDPPAEGLPPYDQLSEPVKDSGGP